MNYSCGAPGDKGTVTNSLEMAWPPWGPQEDMDFIITWSCLVLRGRLWLMPPGSGLGHLPKAGLVR